MMRLALSLSIVLNIGARPIAERGCDQLGEPSADIRAFHRSVKRQAIVHDRRFLGVRRGSGRIIW